MAQAVFVCCVPIISAVGHETDTTIADYVSDLRAPTPSAAAELAVYEYRAVADNMDAIKKRLENSLLQKLHLERMKVERYALKLKYLHPETRLREKQQLAV